MKINPKIIPQRPGVYLYKNTAGEIIYIGKAKKLKNRVATYFQQSATLAPDKKIMVSKIKKVEFIITSSEVEALLLESNLIKKHQPPYNIDLKDDKNFLYIKITLNEEYPRVFTVRRILKDKAKYFGPFVSAISVRRTLHLLHKLFPHRNFPKPPSPHHLRYLTKRYPELLGPADKKEYQQTIARIIQFLKGHYKDVLKGLKEKMARASQKQQFEKAAGFRDKIQAIELMAEKQKVVSTKRENQDIISLAAKKQVSAVNLFIIRNGILINKQNFILKNTADQTNSEIIQAFIEQYYPQVTDKPKQLIIPIKLTNNSIIEKTFSIKLIVPKKGVKKQYLTLGQENAKNYLEQQKASWQKDEIKIKEALTQFVKFLELKKIPKRIEVFDISNIQGADAVGSMVVFTNGQPDKKWYRKFKIKTVKSSNDPAMMAEVLKRRFSHLKSDCISWPKPDLIILDGGKGQLNAVLKTINLKIPLIALAKKQENIYMPDKKTSINFPNNSAALFLIQRMRDEAHRFAITFFQATHQKRLKKSFLDEIPGLGPKKKRLLVNKFGSMENIRHASTKELAKIIGKKLTTTLRELI